MEIVSSSTSHTTTPWEPRAINRLARSVLHLVDRQTASSCRLETVISQLEGSVQEALAGKELGEEAVINLQPESKETSAKAAKYQCHFTKGRGTDTKNAVGLKEGRVRLDAKRRKRPKVARNRKELLQPVILLHPALQNASKKVH